eukprot:1056173-Pleurochrysis_carterae.AAC.1
MELTAPESSHVSQVTTGPCKNAMEPGCPEADNGKSPSAARPGALPRSRCQEKAVCRELAERQRKGRGSRVIKCH